MQELDLITPPVAEPITLAEAKLQLGFSPMEDYDPVKGLILSTTLRPLIAAARQAIENDLRRPLLTQVWRLRLDGWPKMDLHYENHRFRQIIVPQPPLQSIVSLQYIDTSGNVQTMPVDDSYGNDVSAGQYRYQLIPSGDTQPARIAPAWATPWPPVRWLPGAVMLLFKCGYGGPITVSMTASSAALTTATVFNPGDVGQAISVLGAGASGAPLNTTIAAVDGSGHATLAAPAAVTVTSVTAWAGVPIPGPILSAIKFHVQFIYENGGIKDAPLPRVVQALINPYRNMVA